ncbi:hypothetical protein D0Y65_026399 [Glycine soja]|uniref:DUF659 domain-containing protein n=1 Tax=Glycine soja TaxID=3848 RepID=A0A445IJU4_GLYSO|nr:hypothetical protein D0Y65_026399 [Glycine soja]
MSKKVILPTAASHRRQPLLLQQSESYRKAGTRVMGEAVGGTAAVCCCFSFGLANIMYLAMYKVPAMLCQKALRRKRRSRRLLLLQTREEAAAVPSRPRCTCGCCDDIISAGRVYPLCSNDGGDVAVLRSRSSVEKDKEVVELEKEMWERFYGSGFWRSPSQRENSSPQQRINATTVSAPNYLQTGEKIFELFDATMEEVGEENVVQVVTDNGSNYVLADIGKLPLIRKTSRRAINLVGFIYAYSSTLSLLRNFTNKRELVRHAITRFATSYLTLERLPKEKVNIRKMFTSDEWTLNKLSKELKGKEAAKVVLMPFFWNSVVYTLKVMAPLVKVLHLVDGERKLAMGYIYAAMDKANETIIKSFNNNESKYKDVFAIIDKRWNCQFHRPLHAAAHFLNLEFFYDNTDLEFDFEVTNDLFECIKKFDLEVTNLGQTRMLT